MTQGPDTPAAPAADSDGVTAADFRKLKEDYESQEQAKKEQEREAAARAHHEKVRQLIDKHISDGEWNAIVHEARRAAAQGLKEYQVLRFPSELCTDGGRAINAPEPDWPKTLQGEAADIYAKWDKDLRPGGFHLAARVVDFPDGVPGDIGLFLIWGG
jgi:hypothetical protein